MMMMLSRHRALGCLALLAVLALLSNMRLIGDVNRRDTVMVYQQRSLWPAAANGTTAASDDAGLDEDDHHDINVTAATITTPPSPHIMYYMADFGLGHRLIRNAAAWHLAHHLGGAVGTFRFFWGDCGTQPIFSYLFGTFEFPVVRQRQLLLGDNGTFRTSTTNWTSTGMQQVKQVRVRNDVYGYLPAESFIQHNVPLVRERYKDLKGGVGPFASKLASDVGLYRQLRDRFVFGDRIRHFMDEHKFHEHTVVGLHLRAGNGEKTHFAASKRGITNETEFVDNLAALVKHFLYQIQREMPGKSWKRPPLVFLATDTAYLVPRFSNATQAFGVPTVVLPQIRVAANHGIIFSTSVEEEDKCLLGWQAMVSDMVLLSHADVLIAARHSSFTQSIPMTLILHDRQHEPGPHFCEVASNAVSMTCLQDLPTWLFRDDPTKEWNFTLVDGSSNLPVRHKVLTHLPEPELHPVYKNTMEFLMYPLRNARRDTHTYGHRKFYPRYRFDKISATPGWNFVPG